MTEQTAVTTARPLPPAVYTAFDRAAASLTRAADESQPAQRYVTAHVAALQITAAVLAARSRPGGRGRPKNAWVLLSRTVPELAEWSSYFAAGAAKRALAESGLEHVVSEQQADELLRAAWQYFMEVADMLGLSPAVLLSSAGSQVALASTDVPGPASLPRAS